MVLRQMRDQRALNEEKEGGLLVKCCRSILHGGFNGWAEVEFQVLRFAEFRCSSISIITFLSVIMKSRMTIILPGMCAKSRVYVKKMNEIPRSVQKNLWKVELLTSYHDHGHAIFFFCKA